MIRYVLFDLDGTLIDSLELYVQAVKRTLKDTIFAEVPTERLETLRLNSRTAAFGVFRPTRRGGSRPSKVPGIL